MNKITVSAPVYYFDVYVQRRAEHESPLSISIEPWPEYEDHLALTINDKTFYIERDDLAAMIKTLGAVV